MSEKYIDLKYNSDPSAVSDPKNRDATITGISKAASAVVTAANTYAVNDLVAFNAVVGMTEINGLWGAITAASATQFTVAINSTGFTTYTSGGVAVKVLLVSNDITVLYKDDLPQDRVIDALQRAKEKLTAFFATN